MLAAGSAILDLYHNYGQVIPFSSSLNKLCPMLYDTLLAKPPEMDIEDPSDVQKNNYIAKYEKKLYAYKSSRDANKITNVPAVVGFICHYLSLNKSLELVCPMVDVALFEGVPDKVFASDGSLLPKRGPQARGRRVDQFTLKFKRRGVRNDIGTTYSLSMMVKQLITDPTHLEEPSEDDPEFNKCHGFNLNMCVTIAELKKDGVKFSLETWKNMKKDPVGWVEKAFPLVRPKSSATKKRKRKEDVGDDYEEDVDMEEDQEVEEVDETHPSDHFSKDFKVAVPSKVVNDIIGDISMDQAEHLVAKVDEKLVTQVEILCRMVAAREAMLKHSQQRHLPISEEYFQEPPKISKKTKRAITQKTSPHADGFSLDVLQLIRAVYQYVLQKCVLEGGDVPIDDPLQQLRKMREVSVNLNDARRIMAVFCRDFCESEGPATMLFRSFDEHKDQNATNVSGMYITSVAINVWL